MRAQTDLRVEAVHLRRFYNNFASVRSSVTPPLPVPGMDTEAVLVETFEPGALPHIHPWPCQGVWAGSLGRMMSCCFLGGLQCVASWSCCCSTIWHVHWTVASHIA